MNVFVIPVAPERYELYYEHTGDLAPDAEPPPSGIVAKLQRRFSDLLRAAEEHHHRRAERVDKPQSWFGRVQDRLLSWMAERIVEQQLLWNLRKQTTVAAVHPRDVAFDQVLVHIQQALKGDYERHRLWLVVDAVGLVLSWPLTVIPGPNFLLFYFLFRVGGHWMSMRGASQGRHRVTWTGQPSETLVKLRASLQLHGHERQRRIQEIASELHLRNLPAFVERFARVRI
jgi:hypothetical protein